MPTETPTKAPVKTPEPVETPRPEQPMQPDKLCPEQKKHITRKVEPMFPPS